MKLSDSIIFVTVLFCASGCVTNFKNFRNEDLWFKIAKDSVDFDRRLNTDGYFIENSPGNNNIIAFYNDGTMGVGHTGYPMTSNNTHLTFGPARIVNDTIFSLSATYGDSPFCWHLASVKILIINRDSIAILSESYISGKNDPPHVRTFDPDKTIYHFVADSLPQLSIDKYDIRYRKWIWDNKKEWKKWKESVKYPKSNFTPDS